MILDNDENIKENTLDIPVDAEIIKTLGFTEYVDMMFRPQPTRAYRKDNIVLLEYVNEYYDENVFPYKRWYVGSTGMFNPFERRIDMDIYTIRQLGEFLKLCENM